MAIWLSSMESLAGVGEPAWRTVDHEGEVLESVEEARAAKGHRDRPGYGPMALRSRNSAPAPARRRDAGPITVARIHTCHSDDASGGCRRKRSLQMFVAVHASVHDRFNSVQSLSTRATFKKPVPPPSPGGGVSSRHREGALAEN